MCCPEAGSGLPVEWLDGASALLETLDGASVAGLLELGGASALLVACPLELGWASALLVACPLELGGASYTWLLLGGCGTEEWPCDPTSCFRFVTPCGQYRTLQTQLQEN